MRYFDKARLQAELRRDMAENRKEIAARQRQRDAERPRAANIAPKIIVYKTIDSGPSTAAASDAHFGEDDQPLFNDGQEDVLARVIAMLRDELKAEMDARDFP